MMISAKTTIKLLLLSDPTLAIEDIQASLNDWQMNVSPLLVAHVRRSFLSDLKLLRTVGCRVGNADRRLLRDQLRRLGSKSVNKLPAFAPKSVNKPTSRGETRRLIITLLKAGTKQSAIARQLNVSRAYVCQIATRHVTAEKIK